MGSYDKGKNNSLLAALESDIDCCLDILKINKYDDKAKRQIGKLYSQNIAFIGIYRKRLVTLKIVADFLYLRSNILSLCLNCDFLMLSTTPDISAEDIKGKKNKYLENNIILTIYRELMESYQTANDSLKK